MLTINPWSIIISSSQSNPLAKTNNGLLTSIKNVNNFKIKPIPIGTINSKDFFLKVVNHEKYNILILFLLESSQILYFVLMNNFLKLFNKDVYDDYTKQQFINKVLTHGGLLSLWYIYEYGKSIWQWKILKYLENRIHLTLFHKLLQEPYKNYSDHNPDQLLTSIKTINYCCNYILTTTIKQLGSILPLIYNFIIIFKISPLAIGCFMITLMINGIVGLMGQKKFNKLQPQLQSIVKESLGLESTIFQNLPLSHIYNGQDGFVQWEQKQKKILNKNSFHIEKLFLTMGYVSNFIFEIGHMGTYISLFINGSLGNIAIFKHNLNGAQSTIGIMFRAVIQIFKKIREYGNNFQAMPWKNNHWVPFRHLQFTGGIKIINGGKKYNNQWVFRHLNWEYNGQSQWTTIKGPSGCGKTTFLRVIANTIPLDEGQLLFEAKTTAKTKDNGSVWYSVDEIHGQDFSNNVVLLTQDVNILERSIEDNLSLGKQIDVNIMNNALRHVNLMELIEQKKDGLGFVLRDGGSNISGGQRQRIAIARAMVFNTINHYKIILMDEYDSALDQDNKKNIKTKMKEQFKGVILSISHDDTIENSDKLIEFSDLKKEFKDGG